ncbi:MAG: glycosyltransferase family 4 protein [Thermodesulfobacteriota bacterium]
MSIRNQPPKIDVAMLGARMHYALPKLFHEAGMLGKFYTDIYLGNKPWLERLLNVIPSNSKILQKLSARRETAIPPEKVVSFDILGLSYWWRQNRSADFCQLTRVFAHSARTFDEMIIRHGLNGAKAIYGFNSASLELFEFAKDKGITCILEQTIAPQKIQRQLVLEEIERWQGWQPDPGVLLEDDPLSEREEKEWELADLILAGSQFVVDGLTECGVSREKCKVVQYGVSLEKFKPASKGPLSNRPLRVLFVGEVGLRKGVPYLLEALKLLDSRSIEARFAGRISLMEGMIKQYRRCADFLGAVPRNQIGRLYNWADVLVIPSICEGSATVTYEALASGIPVITTPNTGSFVDEGLDGHIVSVCDAEAIARFLESYISKPELLYEEQKAAVSRREKVGLKAYGRRLLETIYNTNADGSR